MEAYITTEEYRERNPNTDLSNEDLQLTLLKASEKISELCRYQFDDLESVKNKFIKAAIKRAAMMQADWYVERDGYSLYRQSVVHGDINSVSIGSFSYEKAARGAGAEQTQSTFDQKGISEEAYRLLSQYGLLYAGVGVRHGY